MSMVSEPATTGLDASILVSFEGLLVAAPGYPALVIGANVRNCIDDILKSFDGVTFCWGVWMW